MGSPIKDLLEAPRQHIWYWVFIISLIYPGLLALFVFAPEFATNIDTFKLLALSIALTFPVFIFNTCVAMIISTLAELFVHNRDEGERFGKTPLFSEDKHDELIKFSWETGVEGSNFIFIITLPLAYLRQLTLEECIVYAIFLQGLVILYSIVRSVVSARMARRPSK